MAIRSLKNGIFSRSLLIGNTAYDPPDFNHISTVTVGSGGTSTITFSSIPSTYTDLQIIGIARTDRAGTTTDTLFVKINSDNTNYYTHGLYGTGSSAGAYADSGNPTYFSVAAGASVASNVFSSTVWELLDYSSTNKYKTIRVLRGYDDNSVGTIRLTSSLWASTSAVTSLTIQGTSSQNIAQYSAFSLYGIN